MVRSSTVVEPLTEVAARVDGSSAKVTLTADGAIRWTHAGGRSGCVEVESEVLGVQLETGKRKVRVKAFVRDGAGRGAEKGATSKKDGKRVRKDIVLDLPSEEAAAEWTQGIRDAIDSLGRPKRLFVILNPHGGRKFAKKIFKNEVKPLLDDAGVNYTLHETQYQLHAYELAYQMDLLKYNGIVCVSGDGILVEVLNGLLKREDWESAIKMPLGLIPAGTGNGMVKSLLDDAGENYSVVNAVFAIIRGHKRALDVATISQGKTLFFSALMLSWGLIADIDIESEKFRWLGKARFEVYPLLRVINLRKYDGHVSFVPAPGYETFGTPVKASEKVDVSDEVCDDKVIDRPCGYTGPKTCYKSSEWRSIEGPFVSIWLHNVPWSNTDVIAAPDAKFSDGCYDLVVVRDCPKAALLGFLLGTSTGSHVNSPYVDYLKVKAFRLVPGQLIGKPNIGGIVDSDGEVLARGTGTYQCGQHSDPMVYGPPIEMHIEQALATIYCPV